ncbi:MAG TPA: MIP/aquaporin family protein [Micromonosporaceae bacterium]
MQPDLVRRLIAEVVGTAILVAFGAGSVVAALTLAGGTPNSTINYPALGMIALTFGLAIAIAIYAYGTVSGAHINPAVTISLAAVRRFPWAEVIPYIIAQLVGAFAGGLLIIAVFGTNAANLGADGGTKLGTNVSWGAGIVAELIGTFLLVLAIMALAVDRRAPSGWAGLMIGFAVTAAILMVGPLTGGSLNPARTFGPYLSATIFGGSVPWSDYWVYIVGPIVGGLLAAASYEYVARPARPEVAIEGAEGPVRGRKEPVPTEAGGATGRHV